MGFQVVFKDMFHWRLKKSLIMAFNRAKTSNLKTFYVCCVRLYVSHIILIKHLGNETNHDN